MSFWDYIHIGQPDEGQQHHNLQEGLFQIASQTCSILVQVNNTNNISYGNNSTNVQYNNFNSNDSSRQTSNIRANNDQHSNVDREQIVLIPSTSSNSSSKRNLFSQYRHRLSVSDITIKHKYFIKKTLNYHGSIKF